MNNHDLPEGFKMTELGPLPQEWEVVKLGEVAAVDWGNTSITKSLYKPSGYLAFSAAGPDGFLDFYEQSGEAVIVSAIGARCGKCFYASDHWTAIKNTIVIRGAQANNLFLYFYLDDEHKWPKSGSGQPFISMGKAKNLYIPLPPLPEQRAIAQVLRTVQRAKEATERVLAATRELKKSLMRHLFTYGPVPVDQADQVRLQETELGPLPEGWRVVKLGEVAKVQGGYAFPSALFVESGVPIIRISNVKERGIVWRNMVYWSQKLLDQVKTYLLNEGDVLISMTGDVGICCPVRRGDLPALLNQRVGRVVTKESDALSSDYLYSVTLTTRFKDAVRKMSFGAIQKNVSAAKIESIPIPLPPLAEQQAIAEILQTVDRKIQAEERRKAALDALFKTLLQHLMTGKVRVRGDITEPEE